MPLRYAELATANDVDSGTGIWAADFAHAYPNTHVVSIDLSSVALHADFPTNLEFRLANAFERWASFPEASVEYVHTRTLSFGIPNWEHVIREAFCILKPGGCLELQEVSASLGRDDRVAGAGDRVV